MDDALTDKPFIIGIAGPSGSGKTTLCKFIEETYNDGFLHLKLDDFFKNKEDCPTYKHWMNWETPDSIYFDELREVLEKLKSGQPSQCPVYAKRETKRTGYRTVEPKLNILVDGFMLFYQREIRDLLDLKIFVAASPQTQLERRLQRQPDLDIAYFNEVIAPAYQQYIEPMRAYADITLNADKPMKQVTMDLILVLWAELTHHRWSVSAD